MNTPKKPKAPVRWAARKPVRSKHSRRTFGLMNDEAAAAFGKVVSYWPHVEEQMMAVLEELLTGRPALSDKALIGSARQVFRALGTQHQRIRLMTDLLQKAPHNKDQPEIYDWIIREFYNLNAIRNDYVHGLWWISPEHDEIIFSKSDTERAIFSEARTVEISEIMQTLSRMRNLVHIILKRTEVKTPQS